jgi:hypothetical protein
VQAVTKDEAMKRRVLVGVAVLLADIYPGWARSLCADEFPVISAMGLKEKLDCGEKFFLLNPLSNIEFSEGHIPGSVNIPMQAIMDTDELPPDKDTLIVTYRLGPK